MKKGYKGFKIDPNDPNKLLSLFDYKFDIDFDKIYYKDPNIELKLCSNSGFHYCNELYQLDIHYPFKDKNNVYYEIEILGNYLDGDNKSICNSFRLLNKIKREEIDILENRKKYNLDKLDLLIDQNPEIIIGGSLALVLRGIDLSRLNSGIGDIDIILPYFKNLLYNDEESVILQNTIDDKSFDDDYYKYNENNDFNYKIFFKGIKIDVKIDPYHEYDYIYYNNRKYKVTPLLNLLEAKIKYALKGSSKHTQDILDIIKYKK